MGAAISLPPDGCAPHVPLLRHGTSSSALLRTSSTLAASLSIVWNEPPSCASWPSLPPECAAYSNLDKLGAPSMLRAILLTLLSAAPALAQQVPEASPMLGKGAVEAGVVG